MTTLRYILIHLGRGWLVLWISLVPLFHIHPEHAHSHGASEHVHGPQYHSVISDDHSHEFHKHHHLVQSQVSRPIPASLERDHLRHHVTDTPEIGFSFLTKSGDDFLVPQGSGKILHHTEPSNRKHLLSGVEPLLSGRYFSTRLLTFQQTIRPPPYLFS